MAFWKKIFKSKYTGREIDAAVAKAGNLPATTSADAGKALVVDEEGKVVTGSVGVENGYIFIDITSATAGTVNSVKFNDVEKGVNWLKDSKNAAILSISQVVIQISNDQYTINGNWINTGSLVSGIGAYTLNTPDGLEFGLCDINFVFEYNEITANFERLLTA